MFLWRLAFKRFLRLCLAIFLRRHFLREPILFCTCQAFALKLQVGRIDRIKARFLYCNQRGNVNDNRLT
jgi:hypothetical protein